MRFKKQVLRIHIYYNRVFLVAQLVKNSPVMRETWVQSLGWGRSPGKGKGYPLQYSGLENSMDCIVLEVAKSQTQLRDFHLHLLQFSFKNTLYIYIYIYIIYIYTIYISA